MKAVRLARPGQPLAMQEVDVPAVGSKDVLVRVKAAGICRSDMHYRAGVSPVHPLPMTLGHEVAGVVETNGGEVRDGLRIIDVSNRAAPAEVGFYDTGGSAYGVTVTGHYAYVADADGGLLILRFTGGPEPVEECADCSVIGMLPTWCVVGVLKMHEVTTEM